MGGHGPAGSSETPSVDPMALAERSGAGAEEGPDQEEYLRLERLLSDNAQALSSARKEAVRLRHLLRDALAFGPAASSGLTGERSQAQAVGSGSTSEEQLRAERDVAVMRALEAEARCAEAIFRLDEVAGHLKGANAGRTDGLELRCAELSGAVRGLRAALAEAEEARDTMGARLMLLEHDNADGVARELRARRELAELREELELQALQTRTLHEQLVRALPSADADALRGELAGLRARYEETDRAYRACRSALTAAQGSADEAERSDGGGELNELAARNEELRADLDRVRELLTAERDASRGSEERHRREVADMSATLDETRRALEALSVSVRKVSIVTDLPADAAGSRASRGAGLPLDVAAESEEVATAEQRARLSEGRSRQLEERMAKLERGLRTLRIDLAAEQPVTPERLDELLALLR